MSYNILIIEDEDIQRELLAQMIIHLGFNAKTASTGKEGLGLLASEHFDLALIDIHLPDISGFQVFHEIRSRLKITLSVFFMSVDSSDESAILGISSGADGYLAKPVRLNDLARRIASILHTDINSAKIKEITEEIRKEEDISNAWSKDLLNYMLEDGVDQKVDYLVTFASVVTYRFAGLNRLADSVESSVFHRELSSLIDDITRVVYRNRGAINHIVNETVTATFGTPVVYDLDTINAMMCAGELLEHSQKVVKRFLNDYSIECKCIIGITSGKIYSGDVSGVRRLNHAVIGRPVMRSQLMISLDDSLKNTIIIDSETKNVLEKYAVIQELELTGNCFQKGEVFELTSIEYDKVKSLPNIQKQYTPKDIITEEGYEKL